MVRYAPQALMRPRWLAAYARTSARRTCACEHGRGVPARAHVLRRLRPVGRHPAPTWTTWPGCGNCGAGPFLSRASPASTTRRAVDAGRARSRCPITAATTWNGTPATIRVLPAVAAAVGGQVEVLLDGGIRRGGLVKAVALGARAVMIGRAYLWGLAPRPGRVENVLDILRGRHRLALLGLGKASIGDLAPGDIVVRPRVHTAPRRADGPVFDPRPTGRPPPA